MNIIKGQKRRNNQGMPLHTAKQNRLSFLGRTGEKSQGRRTTELRAGDGQDCLAV